MFSSLFASSYAQRYYYPRTYYPRYHYYYYPGYYHHSGKSYLPADLDSTKSGFDGILNMSLGGPGNAGLLIGYSPKALKGFGFFVESKFIMLNYNEEENYIPVSTTYGTIYNYRSVSITSGTIFNAGIIIPTAKYKKDVFRLYLGGGINKETKKVSGYRTSYEIKEYPATMSFGVIWNLNTLAISAGIDHRINGHWKTSGGKSNSMFNIGLGFRL